MTTAGASTRRQAGKTALAGAALFVFSVALALFGGGLLVPSLGRAIADALCLAFTFLGTGFVVLGCYRFVRSYARS